MILYFKTSNNLSFNDEICFTTVAGKYPFTNTETKVREEELKDNLIPIEKYKVNLVRSSVIYGANATGKSNLLLCIIKAIDFIEENFSNSNSSEYLGQYFSESFNRLNLLNSKKPISICFGFIVDDNQFEYSFSFSGERILAEQLHEYKSQKPTEHFSRTFDEISNSYTWKFSKYFTGERDKVKSITNERSLYLTVGSVSNLPVCESVFGWFRDKIFPAYNPEQPGNVDDYMTLKWMHDSGGMKDLVLDQLRIADFGIIDFKIKVIDKAKEELEVKTVHNSIGENGEIVPVELYYYQESEGTKRFIAWIGYWIALMNMDKVILIDEFGISMHSLLSKHLLSLVNEILPEGRGSKAQLIFTTHDTNLLTRELFRPDQIWFTEKDSIGNSKLYPLSDFKLLKGKNLETTYLQGLYGGIPHLKRKDNE